MSGHFRSVILLKNLRMIYQLHAIYLTVYPKLSLILNEYGFARTDSRNIANKIWSIANDWTALITGRKNAKQVTLAMVIHRITTSKEVKHPF